MKKHSPPVGKVDTTKRGRTVEGVFNGELATALRTKHPLWHDCVNAEQTGVLEGKAAKHPDIVVRHPGGMPVIVETEYMPANTVEDDAEARLGKKLESNGQSVEHVIALRVPQKFKTRAQSEIQNLIKTADFEFCVFSCDEKERSRWPDSGWITGGIDELATFMDFTTRAINRGITLALKSQNRNKQHRGTKLWKSESFGIMLRSHDCACN